MRLTGLRALFEDAPEGVTGSTGVDPEKSNPHPNDGSPEGTPGSKGVTGGNAPTNPAPISKGGFDPNSPLGKVRPAQFDPMRSIGSGSAGKGGLKPSQGGYGKNINQVQGIGDINPNDFTNPGALYDKVKNSATNALGVGIALNSFSGKKTSASMAGHAAGLGFSRQNAANEFEHWRQGGVLGKWLSGTALGQGVLGSIANLGGKISDMGGKPGGGTAGTGRVGTALDMVGNAIGGNFGKEYVNSALDTLGSVASAASGDFRNASFNFSRQKRSR